MAIPAAFNRLEAFAVTVPAATPIASPIEVDVSFDPGEVVGIELKIPPGHSGLTGLQLQSAHTTIFPNTPATWITGDDDREEWAVFNQTNTGSWQALGYNRDLFDHTFYLRFYVVEIDLAGGSSAGLLQPLPLAG